MKTGTLSSLPLAVAAVLGWAAVAHAQPAGDDASRAVARELGAQGIDAYQANDLAGAEQKLEKAYRLFAAPTLGLWSARTRAKLGHWVEAAERYRQATRTTAELGDSGAQRSAQADAARELEELLPRIPNLTVVLEGAPAAEVSVTLDGVAYAPDLIGMARPTNPGKHQLAAVRGSERVEQSVELVERDRKSVTLAFHPAAAQPSAAAVLPPAAAEAAAPAIAPAAAAASAAPASNDVWRPVGIAALSLGAAGLITWGVSALIANGKLDKCPVRADGEHWCNTEELARPYRTAKTISTLGFWSGAVLAVGGVGALLVGARSERSPEQRLSWGVGPTGVALRGAF